MGIKLRKIIVDTVTFIFLTVLALVFMMPIATVIMNSFKKKAFLMQGKGNAFELLSKKSWNGFKNYVEGAKAIKMIDAIKVSVIITVVAVAVIVLLTWYLTRVKSKVTSVIYYGFVFSMIVPFQMVMYTMASFASMLGLNTQYGLIILYVGFGSGMCVFMFSGFVKAIPYDVEEVAMIDGCNPLVLPTDVKTIPIAIDACTGSHGTYQLGWLMAMLVVAIIPIVLFYLVCQKHIIKGVAAGAVKG